MNLAKHLPATTLAAGLSAFAARAPADGRAEWNLTEHVPLAAAIRGGLVKSLVTDESGAEGLLGLAAPRKTTK